jgi:hypothetical protein
VIITGKVVYRLFAKGSKSERMAVMLVTGDREYVLRRTGVAPFGDAELEKLVGKRVRCEGVVHGFTLFLTQPAVIEPDE